jgi:hypothetical protein
MMFSTDAFTKVCPHCLQGFHPVWVNVEINSGHMIGTSGYFALFWTLCPGKDCQKAIVIFAQRLGNQIAKTTIHPRVTGRAPVAPEVPDKFAGDYAEACAVLEDSPKAAAALARRCLQNLLREHVKIKKPDLAQEIQALLDSKALPADLADDVDAIRHIGNFAAHPMKSTSTGEILETEPGEAEWTLDVMEELFDFYFVRPKDRAAKRAALQARITEAKPGATIKKSPT